MDFFQFIGQYWLALSGVASFLFAIGYVYSGFKQVEKDLGEQRESFLKQREQDYKDIEKDMKEQKKDHDEKITELRTNYASLTGKVDAIKDDYTKSVQAIQLDIREIMTILKGEKK